MKHLSTDSLFKTCRTLCFSTFPYLYFWQHFRHSSIVLVETIN